MTFKGTSESSQRRTVQAAERSRPVLDRTTFKSPLDPVSERDALVARKIELQKKLSAVRSDLNEAQIRRFNKEVGRLVPAAIVARWENEKKDLVQEMHDLEITLMSFKRRRANEAESNTKEFAEVFKQLAKEMLADEVYDRLTVATIHRMSEKP